MSLFQSKAFRSALTPRSAPMRVLLGAALLVGGAFAYQGLRGERSVVWLALWGMLVVLNGFTWFRWYPSQWPRAGIEDHFDKASILGFWCLSLAGVAVGLSSRPWLAWVGLLPALFFLGWNLVLVWFHLHDKDPMQPNSLSAGTRHF